MDKFDIEYTTYDRLLRAWENSMEMVRDFEMYSKRVDDPKVSSVFKDFAEDEGMHATKLRDLILEYRDKNKYKQQKIKDRTNMDLILKENKG